MAPIALVQSVKSRQRFLDCVHFMHILVDGEHTSQKTTIATRANGSS